MQKSYLGINIVFNDIALETLRRTGCCTPRRLEPAFPATKP